MNIEDILKRAQNEQDEMVVQTHDKAMKYTYITLIMTAVIFATTRFFMGH